MILAAPLVIPFAEAVGISIATLGIAKASDMVNEYIQENPEKSAMILKTLVPNLGIGEIFMKKGKDEEVEEEVSVEDIDSKDLTREEKAKMMKELAKSGASREKMIKGYEEIIQPGEDRTLVDAEERYDEGGVEDAPKPKFDYKKFFRNRRADGGAIGIEVLFEEKKPRQGLFMGGSPLDGQALAIYNSMKAYGFDDQAIANALQEQGLYTPGSTPDAPDQGIINQQLNQGGGDGPQGDFGKFGNLLKDTEKTFTKDVYTIDKNMYPGAEMTGSFKPTEITGYQDVTSGLYKTEDGKNINHLGLNIKPGIISLLEKLGFGDLDETQFTGLPYKEGYIAGTFTGKNPFDFFKKQQATNAEIAAANLKAKQELDAKLAAEAAAAALQQQMQNTGVTGSNYNQAANIAGGGGGNTATYGGQTAREATYDNDKSTGTSQGYSQHYARGGLATMFKEKR